jgi:aspartate-semialdehyde dehydrogenase
MKVAIIGATGAVGREMIEDLSGSSLTRRPGFRVGLFASPRSAGEKITVAGSVQDVKAFTVEGLKGFDYALMSAGGKFSKQHAPAIAEQGTTVIDNSSAWRMQDGVPLIVPEVNGAQLKAGSRPRIIANPNCSTIQMVVALQPLYKAFGIEQVQVSTYQSVSGTGQKGIRELASQVDAHLKFSSAEPEVYAQPIAFNCLPAIDVLDGAGHCFEEEKMIRETRKIMGLPELDILATTVRVPTFNCHCETVNVRLGRDISKEEAEAALESAPGLKLVKAADHKMFPTPRTVAGDPHVWVSRVRLPLGQVRSRWLQFWIVADNLKKGAATNAVQILETLAGA